jgi:hypothetical protein
MSCYSTASSAHVAPPWSAVIPDPTNRTPPRFRMDCARLSSDATVIAPSQNQGEERQSGS